MAGPSENQQALLLGNVLTNDEVETLPTCESELVSQRTTDCCDCEFYRGKNVLSGRKPQNVHEYAKQKRACSRSSSTLLFTRRELPTLIEEDARTEYLNTSWRKLMPEPKEKLQGLAVYRVNPSLDMTTLGMKPLSHVFRKNNEKP